ncbi:prohibitin family protein [Photobacterium rosenbergii]|uniref:prohibitin family protein n=1 Tax=Photobacterium rosenbergii TaxID=294936 RepID=UPI001C996EE0|nr:prohibitin family protein [Photobacterium rosenbergii]MBY5946839.1 prohibitin family protein [Photobacterium rosenbergii]
MNNKLSLINPFKAIPVAFVLILIFGSFYTVPEGHRGIVSRFGEATKQETPGLHFKLPLVDSVREIEIRTKRMEEPLAVATSEQLAIKTSISANWTVNPDTTLELFRKYGDLKQFEQRILAPRLRNAAKMGMAKHTAEGLIQNRQAAVSDVERQLAKELEGIPVTVDSIQIENIELPAKFRESIDRKLNEKNLRDAEAFRLERQDLEAQQAVNTANADRDAAKARADGEAYAIDQKSKAEAASIKRKGEAEAAAILAKAKALKQSGGLVIELEKVQRWEGQVPTTVMGEQSMPIIDLRSNVK